MKKIFTLTLMITTVLTVFAQAPQKMSYQCIIRNTTGGLVTNHAIGMKISILQGSPFGTVVYSETYSPAPQTNANGLVTVEIGNGTPVAGTFSGIDWSAGPYYLKTEADPAGGTSYTVVGTSQLISVPYALYSSSSESIADNSITSAKIVDGTIAAVDLANNSVTSVKIADASIVTGDLADNSIISAKIADATITATDLAMNAVTTDKINNAAVTGAKIAQGGAATGQVLKWNGTVWNPSTDLIGEFTLPYSGTTSTTGPGISVTNTNTTELSSAIAGYSESTVNRTFGVTGRASSGSGVGVYGYANSTTGTNYGVIGYSLSSTGLGVFGMTNSTSGKNYGVYGQVNSNEGIAVNGNAMATSGITYGVYGRATSVQGIGVYGTSPNFGLMGVSSATSGEGVAVRGEVFSPTGYSGYFSGGRFTVNGNVGINNADPGADLDVNGQVKITGGNPGAGKVLTSDALGLASWQTPVINPWQISGSNIYYNNGKVGIGITSPAALLHVSGTGTGEGNVVFAGQIKYSAPGNPPVSGAGTRMMWYPDKAAFRAGYVDGPYWDAANIGLYSIAMGQSTIASGLTSTALGNATNASGENSTTIGFYTIAPSYCETVIGSNNTTYTPSSTTTWNLNDRLFVIGNGTGGAARSNAMTVLKNGNIGIGIELPGAKLDVAGQVKITGGGPGSGKVLTSDASGLASWQQGGLVLPYIARVNSSNEDFSIINSTESGLNSVISANLTATGNSVNTAIKGTTSSSMGTGIVGNALATSGAAYGVKGRSESSAGIGVEGIAASSTGMTFGVRGYVASPTGYSGHFAGGRFYVEENVGIGNLSPTCKLDVTGNRIRLTEGTEWIAMRTDGSAGFVDLSYNGKISVQGTAATDDILLNPALASKVGIRTWVPMYDLDVTGNIRATGSVYYGGTAGSANGTAYSKPDYVFEDSYQMLQTEQVEEFLNKEKHLPWITSAAKEKKENGEVVDMTRMAFETLESVENIQLQVIEQQKLIQNQQKQINELNALVKTLIANQTTQDN